MFCIPVTLPAALWVKNSRDRSTACCIYIYILYSLLRKRFVREMSTAQHSWHDYKMRHNSLILANEIVDHWDKDTSLQQRPHIPIQLTTKWWKCKKIDK
jgi:hypothetical protein